eukprot:scaffold39849_cov56-Phaeocystis_antarctica.AAC.2
MGSGEEGARAHHLVIAQSSILRNVPRQASASACSAPWATRPAAPLLPRRAAGCAAAAARSSGSGPHTWSSHRPLHPPSAEASSIACRARLDSSSSLTPCAGRTVCPGRRAGAVPVLGLLPCAGLQVPDWMCHNATSTASSPVIHPSTISASWQCSTKARCAAAALSSSAARDGAASGAEGGGAAGRDRLCRQPHRPSSGTDLPTGMLTGTIPALEHEPMRYRRRDNANTRLLPDWYPKLTLW